MAFIHSELSTVRRHKLRHGRVQAVLLGHPIAVYLRVFVYTLFIYYYIYIPV